MKFVIAETRAGSFSYHVRDSERPDRLAICGDRADVDTSMPLEAWEVRTDKSIVTKWCPRCNTAVVAMAAQVHLQKMAPKSGEIVYFEKCQRELKGPVVGFKGRGFGIMLGIVPAGYPAPPPIMTPRLMGELGYLKFDDVIGFFGKEIGDQCVEKFTTKYYGEIVKATCEVHNVENCESCGPKDVAGPALQLVGPSGEPIEVLSDGRKPGPLLIPGPKDRQ